MKIHITGSNVFFYAGHKGIILYDNLDIIDINIICYIYMYRLWQSHLKSRSHPTKNLRSGVRKIIVNLEMFSNHLI